MDNFLGNFSYIFSTDILWNLYEELLTWICYFVSNQKYVLTGYFGLVPPFNFLKWNHFFSTIIPALRESRHYLNYILSREVHTNSQIKRFSLMKLWYTIWMYGGSEFQDNNIKKHTTHTYSFWNCLSRNLIIIGLIIITLL